MLLPIALLILSLVLIIKGGDAFVDAASWMAEKTGIPKLIIGATVVSLATTLPEMIVSFIAAAEGKVDMAIGNAVGSVTANIGLIMGIALIFMPCLIKRKDYLLKSALMLGGALVLVIFGLTGEIGAVPGVILIAIFAVAMMENVREAKHAMSKAAPAAGAPTKKASDHETTLNIFKFAFGAAAIVWGSRLLVDNGSALAALIGVPERIIAITIVAIGTSLPELVTTLTAITKKQNALSVGNIIGANIIDLTLILPISCLLAGQALPVSRQFATVDLPVCLAVGCIALLPTLVTKKFHKAQGVVMVLVYVGYIGYSVAAG